MCEVHNKSEVLQILVIIPPVFQDGGFPVVVGLAREANFTS